MHYFLTLSTVPLFFLFFVDILLRFSIFRFYFSCSNCSSSFYICLFSNCLHVFVCSLQFIFYLLLRDDAYFLVLQQAIERAILACTSREKTLTHSCNSRLAAGHVGQLINIDNYLKIQLMTLHRIIRTYLSSYNVFGVHKK